MVRAIDNYVNDCCLGSRRNQDCINHMHNTIVSRDISYCYLSIIDEDTSITDRNRNVLLNQCGNHLSVAKVFSHRCACHDVIL